MLASDEFDTTVKLDGRVKINDEIEFDATVEYEINKADGHVYTRVAHVWISLGSTKYDIIADLSKAERELIDLEIDMHSQNLPIVQI